MAAALDCRRRRHRPGRTGCCRRRSPAKSARVLRHEAHALVPLVERRSGARRCRRRARRRKSALCSRRTSCTSVDLPEPDGPTMPTISPCGTRTRRRATPGRPAWYSKDTSRHSTCRWCRSGPAPMRTRACVLQLLVPQRLEVGRRVVNRLETALELLPVVERAHHDEDDAAEGSASRVSTGGVDRGPPVRPPGSSARPRYERGASICTETRAFVRRGAAASNRGLDAGAGDRILDVEDAAPPGGVTPLRSPRSRYSYICARRPSTAERRRTAARTAGAASRRKRRRTSRRSRRPRSRRTR